VTYEEALRVWVKRNLLPSLADSDVVTIEGCAAGKHMDRQVFVRLVREDGSNRMWQFDRSFDELMEEVVAIAVADPSYQFLQASAQSGRYRHHQRAGREQSIRRMHMSLL